ncbi:MAG TPA: hypothetical protein DCL15_16725, partial [Chloroflexi bacterium]|nr:hypothetical protein [Chloroflexota bacterium]
DIILIQPEWDDERMFSHNPMYFNSRLLLAEHGFTTVTSGLMKNFDYYQQIMARHGIELHTELVRRELDALQKQPGGEHFLRKMLTRPASAHNGAAPDDRRGSTDALSLQASLNRLEENLDRLKQLIGESV